MKAHGGNTTNLKQITKMINSLVISKLPISKVLQRELNLR